jgi:hypothetical protein
VKVFNGSVELQAELITRLIILSEAFDYKSSALVPGANIKITYETNDLFQLASKTLLGTRAELTLGKTSYIGFT